jgi:hypothetical protein
MKISKTLSACVLSALMLLTSFSLISCKKGDDDPGLTFRSRKARISNEWKLLSGKVIIKTFPPVGGSFQTNINYNEGGFYNVSSTTGATEKGNYEIELSLFKDGRFTKEHNETPEGMTRGTSTEEGTWHFAGGGGNEKKRELLTLYKEKSTFISQNTTMTTSINYNGGNLFRIQRLANNELVLKANQRVTNGGTISEIEEEWNFIPR